GARLLLEAASEDGVLDQLEAHDFERDDLAVRLANGTEDKTHAPLAEQLLDPVGPEGVARRELVSGGFLHERHRRPRICTAGDRGNRDCKHARPLAWEAVHACGSRSSRT